MDWRTDNRAAPRRVTQKYVNGRIGLGAAALGQKLNDVARTADIVQKGNPKEAFGALETATMETLEKMDSTSNSTVTK